MSALDALSAPEIVGDTTRADGGPPVRVVVTGAAGAVGRRVVEQLHQCGSRVELLAVDKADMSSLPDSVAVRQADLETADLFSVFSGADAVVHLAAAVRAWSDDAAAIERESAVFGRLLDALTAAGVAHLVMMSSAMVYGARITNPVPLTEDAPARPNIDFEWAVQRRRLELLAREWAAQPPVEPARAVTVLRPTAVVAENRLGHLARMLGAARARVVADGDPPVQYLHIDDLAAAVVAVVDARYDGAVNVAPDSWIPPDELADLEGPQPRLRVPAPAAEFVSALRWHWGLAPTPPGVVSYTVHPWVVANGRLRDLGWAPSHSNEEAWVASHGPGPLESLARRRRELILAVAAVAALAVGILGASAAARMRRRR